jgi:putative heme iron utilization protein
VSLQSHIEQHQSVTIGSLSKNGYPFSSYAPFVYIDDKVYIFIASIATHSKNLTSNPKSSLFFIEDEGKCDNIFARKRVTLQCDCSKYSGNNSEKIMNLFRDKFDKSMINMLDDTHDFALFEFAPIYGEVTLGFGKSYLVSGDSMNELVSR